MSRHGPRVACLPGSREALEISEPMVAARSDQREHGALGIGALQDPAATRYFNRCVEKLPARSPYALHGVVDVGDVEIIKPERDRHLSWLVEHAADRLAC